MIHIKRNPKTKHYRVVYAGKNGEVLAVSESLKSKQSAWKNVRAMVLVMNAMGGVAIVQDDSTIASVVYYFTNWQKSIISQEPVTCKYKF